MFAEFLFRKFVFLDLQFSLYIFIHYAKPCGESALVRVIIISVSTFAAWVIFFISFRRNFQNIPFHREVKSAEIKD